MTDISEKLSAFLDGELSDAETRDVEAALASDPALRAEMEALMAADLLAQEEFAELAAEPVPLALAAAIREAPAAMPANVAPRPQGRTPARWSSIAAALMLLVIGSGGGYLAGSLRGGAPAAPGWIAEIAQYHAVYSGQVRHLVEVPAAETDHIREWLTGTLGAEVRVPDLSTNGLTFEGARLLVAAGKPVAQLMYTDGTGAVVALCLIRSDAPQDGFATRSLNGFELVSWGGREANFVIVGDEGRPDLERIAEAAALQV